MSSRPVRPPADLVLAHWAGITTRVAWTLLRLGVQPRPDVFHEARLDAVLRIVAGGPAATPEDGAEAATEAWVARIQGREPPAWPMDWRRTVTPEDVPIHDDDPDLLVLRRHYGDHRRLVDLVRAHGITLDTLDAARDRLRAAATSTLGVRPAPDARVDRVLRRLAAHTDGACPPVRALRDPLHRAHVAQCPRCDRTLRLVGRGVLPPDAFVAPATVPAPVVDIAILQLHPNAVELRPHLLQSSVVTAPWGVDTVVISAQDPTALPAFLEEAARRGIPRRHLRIIRRRGIGALSPRGVAGPLLDDVAHELRSLRWGAWTSPPRTPETRTMASMLWGMVTVLAIALFVVGWRLVTPSVFDPSAPLVAFEVGPGLTRATFDVPEDAWVSAFGVRGGQIHVVREAASAADKASWATGDGRYEVVTEDDALLLAIHDGPLVGLTDALASAGSSPAPLSTLAGRLSPQATVRWSRPDVR